jgi:hypothetical protein
VNEFAFVGLVGMNAGLAWQLYDHRRALDCIQTEMCEDA